MIFSIICEELGLFGAFAIIADTDSILPYKPHVPLLARVRQQAGN